MRYLNTAEYRLRTVKVLCVCLACCFCADAFGLTRPCNPGYYYNGIPGSNACNTEYDKCKSGQLYKDEDKVVCPGGSWDAGSTVENGQYDCTSKADWNLYKSIKYIDSSTYETINIDDEDKWNLYTYTSCPDCNPPYSACKATIKADLSFNGFSNLNTNTFGNVHIITPVVGGVLECTEDCEICSEDFYVSQCEFGGNSWDTSSTTQFFYYVLFDKAEFHYFCFGNDNKKNYENMKVFGECKTNTGNCASKKLYECYKITSGKIVEGTNPVTLKLSDYTNYADDRKLLLSTICSDPTKVKCTACPGGGYTLNSTKYSKDNSKTVWETFNTIANCYQTEMTDEYGTFEYTGNNNMCYYSGE